MIYGDGNSFPLRINFNSHTHTNTHLCRTGSIGMSWPLTEEIWFGMGVEQGWKGHQTSLKGAVRGHQGAVTWWFTFHNSRGLEASLAQGMHADPNYSKSHRGWMTRRDHTPPPERKTSRSGGVKNLGRWLEGWGSSKTIKRDDLRLEVDLEERTGG